MKEEISLNERKIIQLEMLDNLQKFCDNNEISYSLAYGTLIGAIRHKGYIPWDDDVDIMIPLPDLYRLKNEMCIPNIKYCDIDTEPHYQFGFSRLADRRTFSRAGLKFKGYGVNIDVYPVINVPDIEDERDAYFDKGKELLDKRLRFIRWRGLAMKYFPINTIPGFDNVVRDYRDYIINNACQYNSTSHYFVFGGDLTKKERDLCTYDFNLFEKVIKVEFEGLKLNVIARYHDFLSYYYGDYMQLPPEEERIPYHGGHYYKK